jgi:hypothetical protein
VAAIPLNSKTSLTITCLMVLSPFHFKREAAQLTIQGIDGVVNITLNQSTLSWSPPPSVMPRYHDKLIYVIQVYTMYNHSYHTTNSTMMELPESALSCYATINVTLTVTSHGFTSKPITETLTYKCPLMSHTAESTYSTASDAFNKLQSITTTTEDPMIVGMSIGTSHSLMTSNVMSLTSHGTSAETPVTFESNNPTDVSKGNFLYFLLIGGIPPTFIIVLCFICVVLFLCYKLYGVVSSLKFIKGLFKDIFYVE